MLDPIPVPPSVREAINPLTSLLHLHTLPLHIHQVILSYIFYTSFNAFLAPRLSSYLLRTTYANFPQRTKLQWNIHLTSFINSTVVSLAALYVLYADQDRLSETWEERMWGYTGLGGMVQAFGAGYFVWDVQVCAANLETLGMMDLLHAVVALSIAILGFVCRLPYPRASSKPSTLLNSNANLCASIHLAYTTEYSTPWLSYPPRLSTSTGSSTSWVKQAQISRSSTAYCSSLHLHAAGLYGVHTLPLSFSAMYGRPYTRHIHLGRNTTTRHHSGL